MKKVIVLGLILGLYLTALSVLAQDEQVQSTQGVEIDASIVKTLKQQSKEDKKLDKLQQKAKKKYIKNVSDIKKMRETKRIKERNIDFYNSRLQIKNAKLEELQEKKGENQ